MERVCNEEHSLQAMVDPKNFKSYIDLKTKLNRVLDLSNDTNEQSASAPFETAAETDSDDLDLSNLSNSTPAPVAPTAEASASSDDDDDLSIFKELARS